MSNVNHAIAAQREALGAICQRYGVARPEVFGSAARSVDFDPLHSDVDALVSFAPDARIDHLVFLDLKEALEKLFGRPVDLVERDAVLASRNDLCRRNILAEAQPLHG